MNRNYSLKSALLMAFVKLTKHHTNTLGGVIVGNRGQIMSAGVLIINKNAIFKSWRSCLALPECM
jgi:hypothetical protein